MYTYEDSEKEWERERERERERKKEREIESEIKRKRERKKETDRGREGELPWKVNLASWVRFSAEPVYIPYTFKKTIAFKYHFHSWVVVGVANG